MTAEKKSATGSKAKKETHPSASKQERGHKPDAKPPAHKHMAEKKSQGITEKKPDHVAASKAEAVQSQETPAAREHAAKKPAKKETSEAKQEVKAVEAKEKPKAEKTEKPKEERRKKAKPIERIKVAAKTLSKEEKDILSKKKKTPRFIRQELYKLPRLKDVWRKSRGIDSKKHEGKKGKGETPNAGYKNPGEARGMTPTGYLPVLVHNEEELRKIDVSKQAAVIAATVGRKRRNEMITAANNLKIFILNPRKGEK